MSKRFTFYIIVWDNCRFVSEIDPTGDHKIPVPSNEKVVAAIATNNQNLFVGTLEDAMTDSADDYLNIFEKLPLETLKALAEIVSKDEPNFSNPVDVMAYLIMESSDSEDIEDALWANLFGKMANEAEYFAFIEKLGRIGSHPFSAH